MQKNKTLFDQTPLTISSYCGWHPIMQTKLVYISTYDKI